MAARSLLPRLTEALYRRSAWPHQAAIAREIGATPSAVDPWLRALTFQRVLLAGEGGLLVDRDRFMRILTAWRMAALRPARPFPTHLPVEEIAERLDAGGCGHVFGFFTAANRYAFFEPRHEVQLYVAPGTLTEARAAIGSTSRSTGMSIQAFEEPLAQLGTVDQSGMAFTSPLQTTLDLRAHPEGGAHAEFLTRNLLPQVYDNGLP